MTKTDTIPAFLFGAGASIPGGFPSTDQLTKKILSGGGIFRHTDESYYFGNQSSCRAPYDQYVPSIAEALRKVKDEIDPFLLERRGSPANYEDIAYVLGQISDCELGEIENPAISPFIDKIEPILTPCLNGLELCNPTLGALATEAGNYVSDVVYHMLTRPAGKFDHLDSLYSLISSCSQESSIIATLNHDRHLENFLKDKFKRLCDGFGDSVNDVRYWTGYRDSRTIKTIKYFKLHGSVDWFNFRPEGSNSFYDDRVGVLIGSDPEHTKSSDGQDQTCPEGRPILAIGTFNKYVTYTSDPFANIHRAWRSAMKMSDRLVVCGYGFGDKGINTQIIEWVYGETGRRLLIISPQIQCLKNTARGAIAGKWDGWSQKGVLDTIESKLENVSVDQLKSFFFR